MSPNLSNANRSSRVTCLERLVLITLFLWIGGVSFFSQAFFWSIEQVLLVSGIAWPSWAWFIIAILQGFALLVPAGLLALFWPGGQVRQIAITWTLGAIYVLLMAPMRFVQPPATILANVLQISLTLLAIGFVLLLGYMKGKRLQRPNSRPSFWLATLVAALAAYPWLMWGALGSPLDSALNLAASLLLGLLIALIVGWFLFGGQSADEEAAARSILLSGVAAVALLLEMSSAFGFGGLQLLLLVVVPSFALAAAAVHSFQRRNTQAGVSIGVMILVGLVVAAPSMMVDPDELALVLAFGTRDLLQWALYAALASSVIGWSAGMILIGFWSRLRLLDGRHLLPASALVSLAFGAFVYFAFGQPGFHGDQLFVILADQADLEPASEFVDVDARRQFVYRTLVDHANSSQVDIKQTLDQLGVDYQSYYLVNGLSVDAGPLLRLWLDSRPEVDRVLQNPVLRPLRAPAPVAHGSLQSPDSPLWNLQLIGADRVWQEFAVTGEGITIGQSDSGVDGTHPELADSYRGKSDGADFNWYDPWYMSEQPVDIGGHGTHTLGTILGASTGVAPGAEWIGCVNLARNLANPSLYLDCLQFMLAPFPQGGDPFVDGDPALAADVLNNSWGCPPIEGCDPETFLAAVRALKKAGIFVVASAGNEGPLCESVSDPLALYDEVLSVGALDNSGTLALFSSVGPVTVDGSGRVKPDLLAPGVTVMSTFPGNSYEYLDGTSMAGPHVAGVVALMWSANPELLGDIDQTEQILLQTATPYQGPIPACGAQEQAPYNGTGFGVVDAYAAIEAAVQLSE